MDAVSVAAEGSSSMDLITNAFTSGAGQIATDLGSLIGGIVPVALPVLGLTIAVGMGIAVIRKVTGRH